MSINHHQKTKSTYTGTAVTKIDTTDPSQPGTPSSSSNYSYTGTFTINWSASTDAGSGISYYYVAQSSDGGNNYGPAPTGVNPPDGKVTAASWSPPAALPEGAYRYAIRAFDSAGRQSTLSNASPDIRVDKTAPTIASFTVTPATANPTESFTITRTGSDAGGSGIKTYQIYRATFATDKCNDTDKSKCVWTDLGDIPSDPASPNTYYYGLHVTDNALNCITEDTKGDGQNSGGSGTLGHCPGGVASDSVVRTDFGPIKVVKNSDNTPPTISASAGAVSASPGLVVNTISGTTYTNDNTPALAVTTDENATCRYSYSDVAYAFMAAFTTTGALSHSKTLTIVQTDGPKTVFVACRDSLGNTNTKTSAPARISFSYTVDTVVPSIKAGIDPCALFLNYAATGRNYGCTLGGSTITVTAIKPTTKMADLTVQANRDAFVTVGVSGLNYIAVRITGGPRPALNWSQAVTSNLTNGDFLASVGGTDSSDNNGDYMFTLTPKNNAGVTGTTQTYTLRIANKPPTILP